MTYSLFSLEGQTALVTGSSRGLGHAIANGLADAGDRVVLNGQSKERVSAASSYVNGQIIYVDGGMLAVL